MKIKGIKKAIGKLMEIEKASKIDNAFYGLIYLDKSTGEVWCREFHDRGHGNYADYGDDSVVCVSRLIKDAYNRGVIEGNLTMKNLRTVIEDAFPEFAE